MNTRTLTVTEAARHFSDYISRVAYRHESFVLCKGKKPVAELRPLPSGRRLGDLPALLRSLPALSQADATVFVVRWADTRREAVIQGLKLILSAGGNLAGVVLAQVHAKKHAGYGYSDSGYYYGKINKYYSS